MYANTHTHTRAKKKKKNKKKKKKTKKKQQVSRTCYIIRTSYKRQAGPGDVAKSSKVSLSQVLCACV